jgi:hypothetical protein
VHVEHGSDESDYGGAVGEDAHDPGSALDLLVDPFERVREGDLRSMRARERGEGQYLGVGLVHQWPDLQERHHS